MEPGLAAPLLSGLFPTVAGLPSGRPVQALDVFARLGPRPHLVPLPLADGEQNGLARLQQGIAHGGVVLGRLDALVCVDLLRQAIVELPVVVDVDVDIAEVLEAQVDKCLGHVQHHSSRSRIAPALILQRVGSAQCLVPRWVVHVCPRVPAECWRASNAVVEPLLRNAPRYNTGGDAQQYGQISQHGVSMMS